MSKETHFENGTQFIDVLSQTVQLPKVVVLSMNMHGFIEIPKEVKGMIIKLGTIPTTGEMRTAYTAQVPNDMTIIQMRATALGVSNYLSATRVEQQNAIIINTLSKYPNVENGTEKDINKCLAFANEVAANIKASMLKRYDLVLPFPEQQAKILDLYREEPKERIAFLQQLISPFSYRVKLYNTGDTYTDKLFTRDSEEMRHIDSDFTGDLECRIMNLRGLPDVLGYISPLYQPTRSTGIEDRHTISMSRIVQFLRHNGVQTVIFLDSTCSNVGFKLASLGVEFPRNMNIYDDPNIASLFLADEVPNFPGGSRKQKKSSIKKQNKKRKSNKRRRHSSYL
jgi:hypothetical protein